MRTTISLAVILLTPALAPAPVAVAGTAPGPGTVGGRADGPDGEAIPAPKPPPAQVPIRGRIVDLEGRPVAGVSVSFARVRIPKSGDLTPVLDSLRRGDPPQIAYEVIDRDRTTPEGAPRGVSTDRDGRFRLEGLGAE